MAGATKTSLYWGRELSHKEDEWERSWETSFAVRQFPAESLK